MGIEIRRAVHGDTPALQELIARSARGLSRPAYDERQIEAAIATVFGVDSELVQDGTYFVAVEAAHVLGCGGWSRRRTLFGGDQAASRQAGLLDPARDAAKIRAFFVDPACARRGVGRAILACCEDEARAAGFRSAELMATRPGIPFYAATGYEAGAPIVYDAGGVLLEFVPMRKGLG